MISYLENNKQRGGEEKLKRETGNGRMERKGKTKKKNECSTLTSDHFAGFKKKYIIRTREVVKC